MDNDDDHVLSVCIVMNYDIIKFLGIVQRFFRVLTAYRFVRDFFQCLGDRLLYNNYVEQLTTNCTLIYQPKKKKMEVLPLFVYIVNV